MIENISTDGLWNESHVRIIDEMLSLRELQLKHKFDMGRIGTNSLFYAILDTLFSRFRNIRVAGTITNFFLTKIREYLVRHKKILVSYFNYIYTTDIVLLSSGLYPIRRAEYPWAISNADLNRPMKILDVGSGISLFPVYLASKGHEVFSIDNDNILMERLGPKIAPWTGVSVNYRLGDVTKLEFNENTFDRIFCISVLEHLEEEKINSKYVNYRKQNLDVKAISEMLRILKPNGKLILTFDWSENIDESRSYKLEDIYERVLIPYRSNLLVDKKPEINWDELKQKHIEAWKSFPPYNYVTEGWSIGVVLLKK